MNPKTLLRYLSLTALLQFTHADETPIAYSGIYPHLAMFNDHGECGTGALVPWQDKLWAITYAPHKKTGSTDKLYSISSDLTQMIHPESIGGTPANRMIHRESNQLFIGPYAVDSSSKVRAIPYSEMFGRLTGNARHLTDPEGKIYYATMEEGIYEVDVKTLSVNELWADEQKKIGTHADLPGYHGKGLYSGQGRLIYTNDGERGTAALSDPTIPSGCLAEWDGKADKWTIVRRAQFADVTGPGGIYGNEDPETDPVWSIGWDTRSLILMALHKGKWHSYRLPKSSHSYDGAHGWNIEWPRIREIGEEDLLMTMHGMFWRFPADFSPKNSAGIAPRSSYLKVVGDFCRWNDKVVLGCDDTARSEFLNEGRLKGEISAPGQSQSNLVFLDPAQLDSFGPALGRGAVWMAEEVKAGVPSDAYLFSGFARRGLNLHHDHSEDVVFTLEVDPGTGEWTKLREITSPAGKATWVSFSPEEKGAWIRVSVDRDLTTATAAFQYSAEDKRGVEASETFAGLAANDSTNYLSSVVLTRGEGMRTLSVASTEVKEGKALSNTYYELSADMVLGKKEDPEAFALVEKQTPAAKSVVERDAASVILVDDAGRRWRLPINPAFKEEGAVPLRTAREVVTERNLLSVDGTFYELPADNAGGFSGLRPVSTHDRRVTDFASYRGLMVIGGIDTTTAGNQHIIRSEDNKAAVWVGSIDDLWTLGKPRGKGGPWLDTKVENDIPSDPYLLAGYDKKTINLSHQSSDTIDFRIEVDLTGMGEWVTYDSFTVAPGESMEHKLPEGYSAYWLRIVSTADCTATAQLEYE